MALTTPSHARLSLLLEHVEDAYAPNAIRAYRADKELRVQSGGEVGDFCQRTESKNGANWPPLAPLLTAAEPK
jgi:hypothetical protein